MALMRVHGKPKTIDLGMGRKIGHEQKCFFIAEIGGNFNTFDEGIELIDAAVAAGADAIKVQTFRAKTCISKHAFFDMPNVRKGDQFKVIQDLELSEEMHERIFNYCRQKGILIFSTPAHKTDVDLLERLGVTLYKIGSDDATNFPLIKYVGKTGKPLIFSTGMCTMSEVHEAVDVFLSTGNDKIILLHCVRFYPCDSDEVNVQAMVSMQKEFPDIPVGYSDHTSSTHPDKKNADGKYEYFMPGGVAVPIQAIALGADVIEKHFTTNKYRKGPDNVVSATPDEFRFMVDTASIMEAAYGDGIKKPSRNELAQTLKQDRKSMVAFIDIPKGTIITEDMLCEKHPGTGIPPKDKEKVIGKHAKVDMEEDHLIKWDELE